MLEERKSEHLRINLEKDVSFPHLSTGLERYRFVHNALPEISLNDVDLTTAFLGRALKLPLAPTSTASPEANA